MNWQGGHYKFLGISKYWSGLGVKKIDDFLRWRKDPPITVAVLDSGIMRDHEAFKHLQGTAVQEKSFIYNPNEYLDNTHHGTNCAAIIAGGEYEIEQSVNGKMSKVSFWNGVAPFVNLYICKIDFSDIVSSTIAAIKHLIKEKKDKKVQVDVISMSIGFETYSTELEKCIKEASLNNIIVVCAACNYGRRSSNSIEFPARFGDVICVGSHGGLGHESTFTSVGREIDILGPGEVISACPVPAQPTVKNAVVNANGTSFAAPYVAGIVAIILANAQRIGGPDGQNLRKAISNNVVMKQILREMASEPGDHTQFRGHGTLDPLRIFGFSDEYFSQILGSITSLSPPPEPDENLEMEKKKKDVRDLQNYDLRKVARKFIPEDIRCAQEMLRSLMTHDLSGRRSVMTASRSDPCPSRSVLGLSDQLCSAQASPCQGNVKVKHVTRPVELLQDVLFSSTMESVNLTLPEFADVRQPRPDSMNANTGLQSFSFVRDAYDKWLLLKEIRHINLEVFCDKIKRQVTDRKMSCLVLPSPSEAAYGDKHGLEALLEFLTQLGGDLVSSVEDLWLQGMTLEDIKNILQMLHDLKSRDHDARQLTLHCEKVDLTNRTIEIPNFANVKVIIHHSEKTDIPNVTIEACTPEYGSYEAQNQHGSTLTVDLKLLAKSTSGKAMSDAATTIKSNVTCLNLPSISDAVCDDKDGVEAWTALLDKIGQVNNLQHLWCGGTTGKPLEWEHLKEILKYLQKKHKAGQITLTVHFFQMRELKGDSEALDIPDISNSNVKVIIHHGDPTSIHHSPGVCAWRQSHGLQVGREHVLNGGNITINACHPCCKSMNKQIVEDDVLACDISLEEPASRDGAAALHATMQKHQGYLNEEVHVTVAVLGSGIYMDHKDFAEIIQDKACFVPEESWDLSVDTLGTGTALASIAAGFTPEKTRLLIAKVVDEHGRSDPAWVAKAVDHDWAADHTKPPADIILILVGFEKFNQRMYEAVTKAQMNGKIVIAAAAHSPVAREISYPARHGDVICVGSHSRTSAASGFSVRGREMDFLVMGEEHPVKAASAETTISHSSVSGTSVAAAMATAVVGYTLMYAESVGGKSLRDKLKSNTMIRELLREACSSRGFHTPDRGYGTLDPDKLFKWGPQHFKDLVKKIAKSS